MTVDYDAPRRTAVEVEDESLEQLAGRHADTSGAAVDLDEADLVDAYDLPGADLSDEDLIVRVIPKQPDEFTCSSCFLVHHRTRLASGSNGHSICKDCV